MILRALLAALALLLPGLLAVRTGLPFLFPSLGPTILLQVLRPESPAARTRDVLVGHAVGFAVGAGAFWLGRFTPAPWQSPAAAMIALGLCTGLLVALRVDHPPAAASTLIAALGLLQGPKALAVAGAAVLLVAGQGLALRALAGRLR